MTPKIIARIEAALAKARDKHPHFADSAEQAAVVICQEAIEVNKAVLSGDLENEVEELGDLVATCIRRWEMVDAENSPENAPGSHVAPQADNDKGEG